MARDVYGQNRLIAAAIELGVPKPVDGRSWATIVLDKQQGGLMYVLRETATQDRMYVREFDKTGVTYRTEDLESALRFSSLTRLVSRLRRNQAVAGVVENFLDIVEIEEISSPRWREVRVVG